MGSGVCFCVSGISRRKGSGRNPHRVHTSTSHDMLPNSCAVMPISLVSAAPSSSPAPPAALLMLINAAYSVASTPCVDSSKLLSPNYSHKHCHHDTNVKPRDKNANLKFIYKHQHARLDVSSRAAHDSKPWILWQKWLYGRH